MNTRGEYVDDRAVGGDGPVRRTRTTVLTVVAVVAALLSVAGAPALALAATDTGGPGERGGPGVAAQTDAPGTTPTPTPTRTPDPNEQTNPLPGGGSSRPPVRPTIADPGDITSSTVRFSGAGTPAHTLRVSGPTTTGSTGCSATVDDEGRWACLASVRSGPQQVFAVQDVSFPALGSASAPASDVIVPPLVTTSRPTNGPVSGTGHVGATVTVSFSGSSADRTATVGADGRWTVSLRGASGSADARLAVTATQTASTADGYLSDLRSAPSVPVTVALDRTAPAAPRITAPSASVSVRVQPVRIAGTGEPDAVLTVYVDRAPVCRTEVPRSGRWECTTSGSTIRPGTRSVTAAQQDAAGNFSPTSTAVRVRVTQGSAAPTDPADSPTGSTGATGVGPTTPGSDEPGPTSGSPGGSGQAGGPGPGTSGSATGGAGSAGSGSGGGSTGGTGTSRGPDWSGAAGDWTASTAYDTTVPTIQAASSWRTVMVATAVAAGFLVLIAGPLALVAGVVRGRIRSPFAGLLGRNRPRSERHRDDVLPTWASIVVSTVVVGLSTLLGVGVSLEARYARLAIAVLLAAAVLTTTVVLASRWAAGTDRGTIAFRVSPWLVLAALVACGTTRTVDLSPAVIVGAVLVPVVRPDLDTAALRLGSSIARGARSATWRSIALLVVAAAGWVLHSVTPSSGFWGSIVSEFAVTLCVGGLGTVVVTLLPLSGSAGHALFEQSRVRYGSIAAVAVALTAAVYSGSAGTHVSPVALLVVAGSCTAAAGAAWIWWRTPQRVPQPASLDERA